MPRTTKTKRQHTITQSLADLGITDAAVFQECSTRDDEFRIVKKHYFNQVLTHHPDKGGDAAIFRQVQTSFELLRDLHTGQKHQARQGSSGEWLFSECWTSGGTTAKSTSDNNDNKNNSNDEAFDMSDYDFDFSNAETPSWDFFHEAAEELVPPYRVELAKSGRSKCTAKGKFQKCADEAPLKKDEESTALVDSSVSHPSLIGKGDVRCGWLNEQSGTYGGWKHLRCWRLPHVVWLGLPDPQQCSDPKKFAAALANMNETVLSGFLDLPHSDKRAFIDHCRNKGNWARRSKKKASKTTPKTANEKTASTTASQEEDSKPAATTASTATPGAGNDVSGSIQAIPAVATSSSAVAPTGTAVVVRREKFVMPQPGVNGASDATVFKGKTFVLTGVFPEVGGGTGLTLGKDRLKKMLEIFGAKVTGSVSGKTSVLIVGKEPGMSKVGQARGKPNCLLASLLDIKKGLDAGCAALEDFEVSQKTEPFKIQGSFSKGYAYAGGRLNGLAWKASREELEFAQGANQPPPSSANKKAPPPPPSPQPSATETSTSTTTGPSSTTTLKLKEDPTKKVPPPNAKKVPPPQPSATTTAEEDRKKKAPAVAQKKRASTGAGAKKRKALQDSKQENVLEKTTSVTAVTAPSKKRKTSSRVAAAAKKTGATSTSLVVAKKKCKSVATKKSTKKGQVKTEPEDDGEEVELVINCDWCHAVCTQESWFLPSKEQDCCPKCHETTVKHLVPDAILQQHGEAVAST